MIFILLLLIFFHYFSGTEIEHFVNLQENKIIKKILNNLFVISGGFGEHSSNQCFIKFNGKVIVQKGGDGMNIVIIERSNKMKIKDVVNINTGTDYLQNYIMIDLIQNHVGKTDIVIISVKKDAFKLMNAECRLHLGVLGSKLNITRKNASYILIGSKDKKVYYEKVSWQNDVYFPHIAYHLIGCWKIDTSIINKKIKLLKNAKTCSMLALNNKTNKFGITKDYCYLFNSDHTQKGSGYWCNNTNEYKVYQIDDKIVKTFVQVYYEENYKHNKVILEPGVYSYKYFNATALEDEFAWNTIKSIKIPNNIMVIISDDVNLKRAIRHHIMGPKQIPNLIDYWMRGPIKKIIVIDVRYKIIFWSRNNFSGYSHSLSYGMHVIPEEFQHTIKSINIKIPNCRISMFYDSNFSDLYGIIENKSLGVKNISHMDNDKIIRSIIIEHIKINISK